MTNRECIIAYNILNTGVAAGNVANTTDPLANITDSILLLYIGKNRRLLTAEMELIKASAVVPESWNEYVDKRNSIVDTYQDEEVNIELAKLEIAHKDAISEYEAYNKEYKRLLDAKSLVVLHKLDFGKIKQSINKEQMDLLDFMLEYDLDTIVSNS